MMINKQCYGYVPLKNKEIKSEHPADTEEDFLDLRKLINLAVWLIFFIALYVAFDVVFSLI